MERYFGTYENFHTVRREDGLLLMNADTLVGDELDFDVRVNEGVSTVWLKNRFGQDIGCFEADFSRKIQLLAARDWVIKIILSFVAFTESKGAEAYWGQVAVMAYDPCVSEEFDIFVAAVRKRMANGARPDINLGEQGVSKVIESKGTWMVSATVPFPEKKKGTAMVKQSVSFNEKMVEAARAKNKGCYALSILFYVALAALVVLSLKACGVF